MTCDMTAAPSTDRGWDTRRSVPPPTALVLAAGLAGWLAGCSTSMPTTEAGCAALGSASDRDECFLAILPGIFRTDPAHGISLTEKSISDPATRDFVWLTVTRDVDPNSEKYCDRIVDPLLKERCKVLVSRPHLHRNLIDGKGPPMTPHGGPGAVPTMAPGAPGGPPPGGAPPGGAP